MAGATGRCGFQFILYEGVVLGKWAHAEKYHTLSNFLSKEMKSTDQCTVWNDLKYPFGYLCSFWTNWGSAKTRREPGSEGTSVHSCTLYNDFNWLLLPFACAQLHCRIISRLFYKLDNALLCAVWNAVMAVVILDTCLAALTTPVHAHQSCSVPFNNISLKKVIGVYLFVCSAEYYLFGIFRARYFSMIILTKILFPKIFGVWRNFMRP